MRRQNQAVKILDPQGFDSGNPNRPVPQLVATDLSQCGLQYGVTTDMPTQPTYTWTHVKAQLKDLQKDDFLLLLHDLYALNADNRLSLTTRVLAATPAAMVARYRKAIFQEFNPAATTRPPPAWNTPLADTS